MRLTLYTDYALRVLIHLALHEDRLCSISEVARTYDASHNHLMKVVNDLVHAGYLRSVRGRKGGVMLNHPAEAINIGAVVRHTEDGFDLVDCGSCVIAPACGLTGALGKALAAFMAVLDGYSLADLLDRSDAMAALFALREEDEDGPDAR